MSTIKARAAKRSVEDQQFVDVTATLLFTRWMGNDELDEQACAHNAVQMAVTLLEERNKECQT
jgi:hypothetical protein